ncbi:MAG: nucleotide exchange factor GrpE [Candidatus Helarchaeota archaeon]
MNSNEMDSKNKKNDTEEPIEINIEGNKEQAMDIPVESNSEQEELDFEIEDKTIEIKESELEALKKELEEAKERAEKAEKDVQYIRADFINYKNTLDKEKREFIKYAEKDVIKDFLDIYDNFERAISNLKKFESNIDPTVKQGFEMIFKQTKDFLEKRGVKPIEAVGKQYDPFLHEVMMSEVTDEHPEDYILEELRKGYYLHDKVLKTSFVKIAKPSKKEEKQANEDKKNDESDK